MRLSEAMDINRQPAIEGRPSRLVRLVCGVQPLHLETFVRAWAKLRFPGDDVQVRTGLFGDLEGNMPRATEGPGEASLIVAEWSDFDNRLSARASAGLQERSRRIKIRIH